MWTCRLPEQYLIVPSRRCAAGARTCEPSHQCWSTLTSPCDEHRGLTLTNRCFDWICRMQFERWTAGEYRELVAAVFLRRQTEPCGYFVRARQTLRAPPQSGHTVRRPGACWDMSISWNPCVERCEQQFRPSLLVPRQFRVYRSTMSRLSPCANWLPMPHRMHSRCTRHTDGRMQATSEARMAARRGRTTPTTMVVRTA